jgi:hypothetical protein
MGVSADFRRALVVSNRNLAPGGQAGAANLYIRDLRAGSYRFVGGSSAAGAFTSFTVLGVGSVDKFVAGAPDFSWVVFHSSAPLLPGVAGPQLYRWSETDGLTIESRMPDGSATTGTPARLGGGDRDVRSVSDDGKREYFSIEAGSPQEGVYLRQGGSTTAISASQIPNDPTTPHPGVVAGISRDGRYAVFLTSDYSTLTPDAPMDFGNIYRYDAVTGELTFLQGTANTAFPPKAVGVPYVSDDGDTIYFHDYNVRAPVPPTAGFAVLYVWRHGTVRYATSSNNGTFVDVFGSPDGRYIAYTDADGAGRRQVYAYDAEAEGATCISCAASGAAAVGSSELPDPASGTSNRRSLAVTDQGQVFFTTPNRLVAADTNSTTDVYMFQNGKVSLISPGNANFAARLGDVTPNGRDVFFTTAQSLVGQDTDNGYDIYDARVGGGLPGQSPVVAAACRAGECTEPVSGPTTSPATGTQMLPPSRVTVRSNQRRATVSIAKVSATVKALHLTVRASQAGRVRVAGSRVTTTIRNASKAGSYTLVVPLSKKTQSLRRKGRRVKVSVKVSLTPSFGAVATVKSSRTLGK